MRNVHLLPTEKPSRLFKDDLGYYFSFENLQRSNFRNQHIYITSDEEIKDRDWFIKTHNIRSGVFDEVFKSLSSSSFIGKKIILTTDPDLIEDGVQAINDEFLEWFVKNPSCEEVDIKKIYLSNNGEWKDVLLPSEWEVDTKIGYKIITPKEDLKHETLEEAADKYFPSAETIGGETYTAYRGFEAGAKWQAKRMFTEDEAYMIWNAGQKYWETSGESTTFEELIEKLKNKQITINK